MIHSKGNRTSPSSLSSALSAFLSAVSSGLSPPSSSASSSSASSPSPCAARSHFNVLQAEEQTVILLLTPAQRWSFSVSLRLFVSLFAVGTIFHMSSEGASICHLGSSGP